MKDRAAVQDLLKRFLSVVTVAAVSGQDIRNAMDLAWANFEDCVQYSVALLNEMDGVVTRNPSDYQDAAIRIWLPEQALEAVTSKDRESQNSQGNRQKTKNLRGKGERNQKGEQYRQVNRLSGHGKS